MIKRYLEPKLNCSTRKQSRILKRLLVFHFQNNQVAKAADGDYDIDIKK